MPHHPRVATRVATPARGVPRPGAIVPSSSGAPWPVPRGWRAMGHPHSAWASTSRSSTSGRAVFARPPEPVECTGDVLVHDRGSAAEMLPRSPAWRTLDPALRVPSPRLVEGRAGGAPSRCASGLWPEGTCSSTAATSSSSSRVIARLGLGLGVQASSWLLDRRLACCPIEMVESIHGFEEPGERSLRSRPTRPSDSSRTGDSGTESGNPGVARASASSSTKGSTPTTSARRSSNWSKTSTILRRSAVAHSSNSRAKPASVGSRVMSRRPCGRRNNVAQPFGGVTRPFPADGQRAARAVHVTSGRRPPAAPRTFRPHSGRTEAARRRERVGGDQLDVPLPSEKEARVLLAERILAPGMARAAPRARFGS